MRIDVVSSSDPAWFLEVCRCEPLHVRRQSLLNCNPLRWTYALPHVQLGRNGSIGLSFICWGMLTVLSYFNWCFIMLHLSDLLQLIFNHNRAFPLIHFDRCLTDVCLLLPKFAGVFSVSNPDCVVGCPALTIRCCKSIVEICSLNFIIIRVWYAHLLIILHIIFLNMEALINSFSQRWVYVVINCVSCILLLDETLLMEDALHHLVTL